MNSNTFSIRRIAMLAGFYWPVIRIQLVIAAVVVAACYLISIFSVSMVYANGDDPGLYMALYSMFISGGNLVYCSGPLIFAWCAQRAIATTLPASWTEKTTFMLGYVFILFPAFLAIVWYGLTGIFSFFTPYAAPVQAMMGVLAEQAGDQMGIIDKLTNTTRPSNLASCAMIASLACFAVASVRRNRLAMGVLAIFGGMALNWLAGVFISVMAFLHSDSLMGVVENPGAAASEQLGNQIASEIITMMSDMMPVYGIICAIIAVTMAALTAYRIKTRQN